MKYIRTKDGRIIKLLDKLINEVDLWVVGGKNNILKQADTIEELCDYLVVKYKNHEPQIQKCSELVKCMKLNGVGWKEHFAWLKEKYKDKLEYVKLGILTDKGLIYVAKMNDKGELELL